MAIKNGITHLGMLIGLSAVISCSSVTDPNRLSENNIKDVYSVIHPVVMDTCYATDYVANIQAVQHVKIKARVSGYLEKIHVDEGQKVKKGQLLFSIDSQQYEAELLRTEAILKSTIADVKSAEVELKNVEELVQSNVVSERELEIARAKLEALQAKVEEARSNKACALLNLSYAQVKAPFDGIVDRIPNKKGSLIEEGTWLTTISDNRRVYVYFNVSEKEYLDIMTEQRNGEEVSLLLVNNTLYPHKGKIEAIESEADNTTGNIAFRASFPNPELLLKHGFTGKVRIKTKVPNALIIPQVATVESQDKMYVYQVGEDHIVKRKAVVPIHRLPHLYLLKGGLTPSDIILYEGLQEVKEGNKVETELISFLRDTPKKDSHLALHVTE